MGGPPPSSTSRKAGILELEAAMDFYEILMLALAVAQLIILPLRVIMARKLSTCALSSAVIQIAQLLFHRRKGNE